MIIFIVLFTLLISVINAWVSGKEWPLAQAQGGWYKLLALSGLIMSGIGFTMIYTIAGVFIGTSLHFISPAAAHKAAALVPAMIIIPLLMTGLVITIESWKQFLRKGQSGWERFGNGVNAAYNTYAMASNTLAMPGIFEHAFSAFKGDDNDDSSSVGVLIALLALLSGFVTAYAIFKKAARSVMRTL